MTYQEGFWIQYTMNTFAGGPLKRDVEVEKEYYGHLVLNYGDSVVDERWLTREEIDFIGNDPEWAEAIAPHSVLLPIEEMGLPQSKDRILRVCTYLFPEGFR
jgi:hypothetical protein